jgi:hypothetical protein
MSHSEKKSFTPGPWSYYYEGSGDYVVLAESIKGQYKYDELGTAWSQHAHFFGIGEEADRNESNAKLISAAPDLLEALEEIISEAEGMLTDKYFGNLAKARAAIAKAKGDR